MAMNGREILIPMNQRSNQAISVPLEQLPDNTEEIMEVLFREAAPLAVWVDVAKAYLATDRRDWVRDPHSSLNRLARPLTGCMPGSSCLVPFAGSSSTSTS